MTHAMPRTKPNIMITARLLLMPVLRSVELNVVDCASAGRVLRAKTAAATRSDGNRERTLGWICLIIFMRVNEFCFSFIASGSSAELREHHLTSARSGGVCHTQDARSVLAMN